MSQNEMLNDHDDFSLEQKTISMESNYGLIRLHQIQESNTPGYVIRDIGYLINRQTKCQMLNTLMGAIFATKLREKMV